MNDLTDFQRRLLSEADSDGRVFARDSREVRDLIEKGYVEENIYSRNCYWVKKNPDVKKP